VPSWKAAYELGEGFSPDLDPPRAGTRTSPSSGASGPRLSRKFGPALVKYKLARESHRERAAGQISQRRGATARGRRGGSSATTTATKFQPGSKVPPGLPPTTPQRGRARPRTGRPILPRPHGGARLSRSSGQSVRTMLALPVKFTPRVLGSQPGRGAHGPSRKTREVRAFSSLLGARGGQRRATTVPRESEKERETVSVCV
jgi:hypothetical protein